MTETVNGAPASPTQRGSKRQPNGRLQSLRVERVFTTPGVHPYDAVTWERRDVVMTNWRDGSVNFEQRGVEFPDFWSVNAANIVTTKYFRGAVGSPQRETRDLLVRVDAEGGEGHDHGGRPAVVERLPHVLHVGDDEARRRFLRGAEGPRSGGRGRRRRRDQHDRERKDSRGTAESHPR